MVNLVPASWGIGGGSVTSRSAPAPAQKREEACRIAGLRSRLD
jgi:hypothetical protein